MNTHFLRLFYQWSAPSILIVVLTGPVCAAAPVPLAGTWRFATDPGDQGIEKHWAASVLPGTIHLPGTTDEAGVGPPGPERRGVLTRRHEVIGPAWYQRDVTVPAAWSDQDVDLLLERVLWQSRVWVDGREIGPPLDSWAVPHRHRLGRLTPGPHRITIRIDNRMIHPLGLMSSSYGPQTQTRWNGVVGRIELQCRPLRRIERVRVFPHCRRKSWDLDVEVILAGPAQAGLTLTGQVTDPVDGQALAVAGNVPVGTNGPSYLHLACKPQPVPWSEFSPKLYDFTVDLHRAGKTLQTVTQRIGFREISHHGNRLLLNGEPIFMRGNLDCCHFPLTGYPAMKKADWLRIFRIYRKFNLNHVRFHTWCPPEAAFEAADELGIYIQASAGIWINEGRDEGKGPGKSDRTVDSFCQAEMRRIVDRFGNHPSFVLMVIGNELGHSNFDVTGQWIKAIKAYDPRRLYAASTARTITPYCDFNATHAVPGIGWVRQHLVGNTDWDYEDKYRRTKVPIISHEIGQWPVYPAWSLCEKASGVLRNTRLEKMRDQARKAGVYEQQPEFTLASGAINQRLYKDEIESFLRTPSCRGFQLLSIEDFQGQGEAYVGWLDMFWEGKGTTDPKAFRGYCAPVSVLARLPKYTWRYNEMFTAAIVLRNDGSGPLRAPQGQCRILDAGKTVLYKTSWKGPGRIEKGAVNTVGNIAVPWDKVVPGDRAVALTFEISIEGKPESNTYPVWVYPDALPVPPDDARVLVTADLDQALTALREGRRVLLEAAELGDPERQTKLAAWRPLYWSLAFFQGQAETLGLLVRKEHPALREFPTADFGDWQWRSVCAHAHGFDLTGAVPLSYRPIVQPVPDFHANRKLGTIFEFRVGPGRLLVCGYDLSRDRCKRYPEVRQLRYSLLRYISSAEFAPRTALGPDKLKSLFPKVDRARRCGPPGFEQAALYVDAAGRHTQNWTHVPYVAKLDNVKVAEKGYGYVLKGADGAWRDEHCSAWIVGRGRTVTLTLQTPKAAHGEFFIHLSDWNHNDRYGRITVEGGRATYVVGRHDKAPEGIWLKTDVLREDTLDGKFSVAIRCTRGSNLMIAAIALVPEK